ncbi:hypothetical protein JYT81_00525, partial [Gammaproteobacteria bacterium AH-315-K14]|nr:hypothetical protein [Gammaproteobacteria bacterium AH-315-K14]
MCSRRQSWTDWLKQTIKNITSTVPSSMLFTMNSIEPLTISPPNKLTSGKNKHFRISLGAKFIGLVVIIILAITGVVGYINIKAEQSLLLKNLIANGESLGKFAALISPEAIL